LKVLKLAERESGAPFQFHADCVSPLFPFARAAGAATCPLHMKSLTEQLWFEVPGRRGFVNITETVAGLVRKSGVQEGLCLVNAMHITASVFINDAEDGLLHDYEVWLEKLAPHAPTGQYHHNRTGEDNADAHMKRQIMGREVVVAITKGKLDFGPWEQIFYGEFDGNRRKRVLVKIIGE
jgi:secondary thiamine-phosphate synthase enzyme